MKFIVIIVIVFWKLKNTMRKDRLKFSSYNYKNLQDYHFSLGVFIRNNILKNDTYLYQLFNKCGIGELDDMSLMIIRMFYIFLNSK